MTHSETPPSSTDLASSGQGVERQEKAFLKTSVQEELGLMCFGEPVWSNWSNDAKVHTT